MRLIIVGVLLCMTASGQTISVGSTKQQLTPTQRSAVASFWPDGNIGATQCGTGTNYVFAPNANPGIIGITLPNLNSWTTSLSVVSTTSNLTLGSTGAFDNNYAGGGTVYYNSANGYLIALYHGEYWFGGSGSPFYSALGMAYSTNCGTTWNKLGEVISPQSARVNGGTNCQSDIGSGTLVVVGSYLYAYYIDNPTGCTGIEPAVARASISSVVAAAVAGTPFTSGAGTLFMKYTGSSTWSGDGVTDLANPQNGGGAFTTIATPIIGDGTITVPNVRYDSYLNDYIMVYVDEDGSTTAIEAQTSSDGVTWGDAQTLVSGGGPLGSSTAIFYPALLNTSGGDPQILGQSFSVFYVKPFNPPTTGWTASSVYSTALSIAGGTVGR